MILAHPLWLLLLVLVPLPWLIARHKGYVGFPDTKRITPSKGGWILHLIPILLLVAGFAALSVALARPQKLHVISTNSFKSRDIILSVDISGSMGAQFGKPPESVVGQTELDKDFPGRPDRPAAGKANPQDYYGTRVGERRVDNAQAATLDFIRNRFLAKAGDRVGLFVFDTDQYWHWPLTHDLKMIYRKVHFADEGLGGGTNFGSTPPGPLDAAAEHLDDMGRAATRVLIMVTDCEDNLYGDAFARLEALSAKYNLKLYVIVVGTNQQDPDIVRLAKATGGEGFLASSPQALKDCFDRIDSMEQSTVTVETSESREELFFYFAWAAIGLFLLGALGEALVLNR
ncbi:MAG: VWA domain-containing protein [Candidatus Melainabacteria bacterium]|mgnify:CR=1 FL=1|nr:VWA domain-containing protein [Candidatus Melainabacteria bacterium]